MFETTNQNMYTQIFAINHKIHSYKLTWLSMGPIVEMHTHFQSQLYGPTGNMVMKQEILGLPSGKQTVCYWKLWFIVDLPIKNGDCPISFLYVYQIWTHPNLTAFLSSLLSTESGQQKWIPLSHDGSMVLVYMLTWRGYIDGIHVTIYSSTMDPMGMNK